MNHNKLVQPDLPEKAFSLVTEKNQRMLHVNKLENALGKEPTLLQQYSSLTLNYEPSTSQPDWWWTSIVSFGDK